uniref:Uncharacterized protein n=1 Tax=Salmonella phage SalP219 TaxID=3158864 RepID=A0AAU7PJP7_9CAUD
MRDSYGAGLFLDTPLIGCEQRNRTPLNKLMRLVNSPEF